MVYHYTEQELADVHSANLQHFSETENKLLDMRQTIAYQSDHLSQWFSRFCQGDSSDLIRKVSAELDHEHQVFERQLNDQATQLAATHSKEETRFQNLLGIINLL